MKSATQTKRQPSKESAKASREATPVRRAEKPTPRVQAEAPRTAAADGNSTVPMPDLKPFGIAQHDAQAHVGQCEQCGRAYRHVVKNPKDTMALESFGRNIAVCLAGKQTKTPA
jgi:hypothetical protein